MRTLHAISTLAAAAVTVGLTAVTAGLTAVTAGPAGARTTPSPGYAAVDGAGSSLPAVALDSWIKDLARRGLTVDYNPDGSAEGRAQYIQGGQVDFAASDPPFRSGRDKLAGIGPEVSPWGYSYVPDLAGGTAFLYHLSVHGHLIRNLRLSGRTLMEIFTGQITNWDNPRITRDYGSPLPDLPIIPVLHAEGAGDSYFLSRWMATVFPARWNAFCRRVDPAITPPCGPTEFYPHFGDAVMENGSADVAGFVSSPRGQGAIGYDAYAYALGSGYPAVRLRNPAGRYLLPTAAHVTTALTRAIIDEDASSPDFLQQDLTPVYASKNPGSYPLASYSYLIVPRRGTRLPPVFSLAAGRSLSAFVGYALCRGQRRLAGLGYAPLPAALVKGGLQQATRIPGHGRLPSLAACLK